MFSAKKEPPRRMAPPRRRPRHRISGPWQAGAGLTQPAFGADFLPHLAPLVEIPVHARIAADGLSHGGAEICLGYHGDAVIHPKGAA